MMHPELMHIIVKGMQADRRQEAVEPMDMPFTDAADATRRIIGKVMIRLGVLVGGHAVRTRQSQNLTPQET